MRGDMTAAAAAAAMAAGVGSAAGAIDFTYVEAGVAWEDVDASRTIANGAATTDAGLGGRVAGGLDLLLGFYVDGEAGWSRPDVDATSATGGAASTGSADGELSTWRLSGGYKMEVADLVALYGQLGYVRRSVSIDDISVSVPGHATTFADLDGDVGGYEVEAGVRAEVFPRLELTGAVRYSDVGALEIPLSPNVFVTIPEETTFTALDFEESVVGEAGFLFDLWGPIALRGTYAFGEENAAFLGLRSQF